MRKIGKNTTKLTLLVVEHVDSVHFERCSNKENVAFAKAASAGSGQKDTFCRTGF